MTIVLVVMVGVNVSNDTRHESWLCVMVMRANAG